MWWNGDGAQESMGAQSSYHYQNDQAYSDFRDDDGYPYHSSNHDAYYHEGDLDDWQHEYPQYENHWYADEYDDEDVYDHGTYDDDGPYNYHTDNYDGRRFTAEEHGRDEMPWYQKRLLEGYGGSETYQLEDTNEHYFDPWGGGDYQGYGHSGHRDHIEDGIGLAADYYRDDSLYPQHDYSHEDQLHNYNDYNEYPDDYNENTPSRYYGHQQYSAGHTSYGRGYDEDDEYGGNSYHDLHPRRMIGSGQSYSQLPQHRRDGSYRPKQSLRDVHYSPDYSRRFQHADDWNRDFDDLNYAHNSFGDQYGDQYGYGYRSSFGDYRR